MHACTNTHKQTHKICWATSKVFQSRIRQEAHTQTAVIWTTVTPQETKMWCFAFEFHIIPGRLFCKLQDLIAVVKVKHCHSGFSFASRQHKEVEHLNQDCIWCSSFYWKATQPAGPHSCSSVQWTLPWMGKPRETKEERECTLLSYVITLHNIHIFWVLIPPQAKRRVKCTRSWLELSSPDPHISSEEVLAFKRHPVWPAYPFLY